MPDPIMDTDPYMLSENWSRIRTQKWINPGPGLDEYKPNPESKLDKIRTRTRNPEHPNPDPDSARKNQDWYVKYFSYISYQVQSGN